MDAKWTVVVVDDNEAFAGLIRRALLRDGRFHVLAHGHDGEAAVDLVSELDPDLLVTDNEMPGLSGLAALRALRSTASRTKVVMFSVETVPGTPSEASRLGAVFVSKLSSLRTLVEIAAATLESKDAQPPFGSIHAR